jgi:hypothetical protein
MIVVMQLWEGDKDLAVATAKSVKEKYPACQLGILTNNCTHPAEMEKYADLIHQTTEDVYHEASGGLAIHELLVLGLRLTGGIIVKIDPNTEINYRENLFDSMRVGVFGKVRPLTGTHKLFVYGSVFAVSRISARAIVDSNILLDTAITQIPRGVKTPLRSLFATKKGLSSHDWPIAYASVGLNIPNIPFDEMLNAFNHVPRPPQSREKFRPVYPLDDVRRAQEGLRSEILSDSAEHVGLGKAVDFVSSMWGNEGVSVQIRHFEAQRVASTETFADIGPVKQALKKGIYSFQLMSVKPKDGESVSLLVLEVDRLPPEDCQASVIKTSYSSFQIFLLMKNGITMEQALLLIDEADFANKKLSKVATLSGVRIPGTASYDDFCLHNVSDDKCTSHKVLADDKVRLVKFVDLYFTYDEALAVIRGLAESYKVRPPVTEPEPALP